MYLNNYIEVKNEYITYYKRSKGSKTVYREK